MQSQFLESTKLKAQLEMWVRNWLLFTFPAGRALVHISSKYTDRDASGCLVYPLQRHVSHGKAGIVLISEAAM